MTPAAEHLDWMTEKDTLNKNDIYYVVVKADLVGMLDVDGKTIIHQLVVVVNLVEWEEWVDLKKEILMLQHTLVKV